MSAPHHYTRWSRAELDTLERCYLAGMRWHHIADAVSAVQGVERTREACRIKAQRLTLTRGRAKGKPPRQVQEDVLDMVILGYSTRRIAAELGISQSSACRRIARLSPQRQNAWRQQVGERVAKGAKDGWHKRRRAAA